MKKIYLTVIGLLFLAVACNRSPQVTKLQPAQVATPVPPPVSPVLTLHTVGQITWHAKPFVNQKIRIQGYLIRSEKNYILFSDESSGPITLHDLPVVGTGVETIQPGKKYILEGIFLDTGLQASNGNPDHLELTTLPQQVGN